MNIKDVISQQKNLAEALDEIDIDKLEELLINEADLLMECSAVNNGHPCLYILVDGLRKVGFKKLCNVFIPYLINNYDDLYKPFMDEILRFCSRVVTKDNVDDIIWCNLEYLHDRLYENKTNDDSIIFCFICKCQDNRTQQFNVTNFILMLELFSKIDSSSRWNFRGHRSMTPLHIASTLRKIESKPILDLGIKYGADINAIDIFGQTILHTACSWKNLEFVEALMSYQPGLINAKDVFFWQPLCIAIKGTRYCRPSSLKCSKRDMPTSSIDILGAMLINKPRKLMTNQEVDIALLGPVKYHCEKECSICFGKKPSYRRVLRRHISENYAFFSDFILQDFEKYKTARKDPLVFIQNLLSSKHVGLVEFKEKNNAAIHNEVMELMERVETFINKTDKLFECEVTVAGSVAEGTKIRGPDEFDVNFKLLNFNLSNPIYVNSLLSGDEGAVYFNLNKHFLSSEELRYTHLIKKGKTISWKPVAIKKRLLNLVYKALSLKATWDGLNLYWRDFGSIHSQSPHLVWTGKEFYPEMPISLDIMPIFKLPTWPSGVLSESLDIISEDEMLDHDCLIMIKGKKFYITASILELHIMRSIPLELKYAYVTCKILMDLLLYNPRLENLDDFYIENLLPTSYELKNILFQLYQHWKDREKDGQERDKDFELCSLGRLPENHTVCNMTRDQLCSIFTNCQEILGKLDLNNYQRVSTGQFNASEDLSEENTCEVSTYNCPMFLLRQEHVMHLRVYHIKGLQLRHNLKKLLL